MDILKFGHHATNQTNPTQTPAGIIKISDKEARERSTIPYIDPNPVPFTTLTLSTPAPSSGPGGTPFIDNSISQQEAIEKAQLFLTRKADSIVEKSQIPPSGNRHDFFSLSPYYWPDPNNPKGPYILKDGQTNPESTAIPDKQKLSDMTYRVKILSLAYHYTNDNKYASKAIEIMQIWFLRSGTYMNPNLQYAEVQCGINNGSPAGIIGGMNLPDVLDGVRLIQNSTDWTKETEAGMEKWFFQYLNWLITSKAGKQEAQTVNNHGTWYAIQTSSIALFLNMTDVAKQIADTRFRKLVSVQIERDGRQPFELLRTRSFDYSVLNLLGLFKLASIGQQMGLNLWTYTNSQGAGLKTALNYLTSNRQNWPHKQVTPMDTRGLDRLVAQARNLSV